MVAGEEAVEEEIVEVEGAVAEVAAVVEVKMMQERDSKKSLHLLYQRR